MKDVPNIEQKKKPAIYSGTIYELELTNGERAFSLPRMKHKVVIREGEVVDAHTDELQEGMILQKNGVVVLITTVAKQLYHGMLSLTVMGELVKEEFENKKFTRTFYEDGRIWWDYKVIEQQQKVELQHAFDSKDPA